MGKSSRSRKSKAKETITFDSWVNERLSALELTGDESSSEKLLKVARFWMLPESKQFFHFAAKLCWGSNRMQHRLGYSNSLLRNVLTAMDNGNKSLAGVWLMTFGLLMEQELKTLIDIIQMIEKANALTQNHDEVCEFLRGQCPYLVLCFYFCKNRARITEWLLKISQTLFVDGVLSSDIAFTRCWITVAKKSDGTKTDLYITQTVQLKTLMMILQINPRHHRLVHRGRSLFLSDGADEKRLHELGVKDKDVIVLVDTAPKNEDQVLMLTNEDNKSSQTITASGTSRKSSLMCRSKRSTRRSSANYTIVIPDKVKHSTLLTRVFEEAQNIFAERRRTLNELAIKKSHPKQRQSKVKLHMAAPSAGHNTFAEGIGGKAGKTQFAITVGEPNFLYRSSKVRAKTSVSCLVVDLHGFTKDEAITRLNESLPKWMESAMKNHPYTMNVDIICGGGSQILSEAVEIWIKSNKHVANRF